MYVFDNKKKAFGKYDPASLAAAAMKKAAAEAAEAARKKAEEASDAAEWFYSTNVPETTSRTPAATAPGATAPGAKAEAGNTMLYLAIGAVVLFFLMKK